MVGNRTMTPRDNTLYNLYVFIYITMDSKIVLACVIVLILVIIYFKYSTSSVGTNTFVSGPNGGGQRTVTLHYTDWCGYCRNFKPIWYTVKARAANSGIIFKEINEEKMPTAGIPGYPTVLLKYSNIPNEETFYAWVMSPVH
jgi:thiol-disulfide isomerase/thioredoxin